jgi:TPM domain
MAQHRSRSLWARLLRVFHHAAWDERDANRALPSAALKRLQATVALSEAHHGGEVRICIEARLPMSYLWRGLGAHERALMMFSKLRVWDTEANNGVLIYLLLAEHAIEIVADRGLARHVAPAEWREVLAHMQPSLRAGQFEQGLERAVLDVDRRLRQHFTRPHSGPGSSDVNELPDAPVLL